MFVKIRETRGADKQAACGQLGNVRLRRQLRLQRAADEGEDEVVIGRRANSRGALGGGACSCRGELTW